LPEVSIVIPFKDRVEWAVEAVESVLGQTFGDFEVILVDDGSSEDHESSFRSLDERIVYVQRGTMESHWPRGAT
jgi:GT2 family glycosyltransferase